MGSDSAHGSSFSWVASSQLFFVALLMGGVVIQAVFYIWLYMQQVQNGYHLAKLYEQHEELLATQRKLRLEWSRFQDPSLLEEMGRSQFGLVPPRPDQKWMMP